MTLLVEPRTQIAPTVGQRTKGNVGIDDDTHEVISER
jgi:hypothetical protein